MSVQLGEALTSSSILDWIQDPRSTGLGVGAKSKAVRRRHLKTVQLFGSVFSGGRGRTLRTIMAQEEEEGHFFYHFRNGGGLSANAYLERGSHGWMATALCVFEICKKYSGAVNVGDPYDKLGEYLKVYSLEEQERKLRECLEENSNGTAICSDHLLAYKTVLEGIVTNGEATRIGGEDNKRFEATFHFIQGIIAFMMDCSQIDIPTRTVECFQAAREVEPDCYVWWCLSFLMIRGYKREWNLSDLLEYSRKAYDLAPLQMKVRTGLCLIWAEIEDAKDKGLGIWPERTLDLIRSVEGDLELSAEPSPLHRKWAARKLSELKEDLGKEISGATASTSKTVTVPGAERKATVSTDWEERWKIIAASKLECPPVWAVNHLQTLPKYNKKYLNPILDYLKCRPGPREFSLAPYVRTKPEGLPDDDAQYDHLVPAGSEEWICTKICVGSLALLLNHTTPRWNTLENCKVALEDNPEDISASHLKAYQYLLNATDLCEAFLEFKTGAGNLSRRKKQKQAECLNGSFLKMNKEWETVENSAVVHFVRGRMAELLGLSDDVSLTHYSKAASLERDQALWELMLYEKRKQMYRSGAVKVIASQPEMDQLEECQKALELAPGNVKLMLDLATVKLQRLVGSLNDETDDWLNTSLEVAAVDKLLREALVLVPSNSRYEMLVLLKIGELYSRRGLPQRTSEAKQIFLECYEKWPKSGMVLHKVAKFFHYNCKDNAQAQKIYEEAMQVAPANFPCLMDYLNLYGSFLRKYREMVKVIDRSLPRIKDPERIVRLLIIKGQAYWLMDREKKEGACDVWLEVFQNFPWLGWKVKQALTSARSSPEFGKIDISPDQLRHMFRKACDKQGIDISKDKPLRSFMAALEKLEQDARSSRRNCWCYSSDLPWETPSSRESSLEREGDRKEKTTRKPEGELYEHFPESLKANLRTRHRNK